MLSDIESLKLPGFTLDQEASLEIIKRGLERQKSRWGGECVLPIVDVAHQEDSEKENQQPMHPKVLGN